MIGIVLLAVALGSMMGLLVNQTSQAIDPVQQVRAAQLAQRLFNEIPQSLFLMLIRITMAAAGAVARRWMVSPMTPVPYPAAMKP